MGLAWWPPGRPRATARRLAAGAAVAALLATGAMGTAAAAGGAGRTATVLGQPVPAGTGALEAVSCGSAADCWAVGLAHVDIFAQAPGPSHVVIDATIDGGRTWQAERVAVPGPTDLSAVDCPDHTFCMATGTALDSGRSQGSVLVTTDSGRAWRPVGAPAGSADVAAVACAAAGRCTVLAGDGGTYWSASTGDGGRTWQRQGTLPAGTDGYAGLACPSPLTCLAAGDTPSPAPGQASGTIAVTTDGGSTWAAATLPGGVGLLHAVACTGPLDCIAVGTASTALTAVTRGPGDVLATTDGGSTWAPVAAPSELGDAFGIACPATTTCAAVGTSWTAGRSSAGQSPAPVGAVATTGDDGTTWRPASTRYVPAGLAAVACPSPTTCVAAGNDVLAQVTLPAPARRR